MELGEKVIFLLAPFILGLLLGLWIQSDEKVPDKKLPPSGGVSMNTMESMFPDKSLPSVPDYKFFVVEPPPAKTDTVEIILPSKLQTPPRVLTDDYLSITDGRVGVRFWNTSELRYEAEFFDLPNRPVWGYGLDFGYKRDLLGLAPHSLFLEADFKYRRFGVFLRPEVSSQDRIVWVGLSYTLFGK